MRVKREVNASVDPPPTPLTLCRNGPLQSVPLVLTLLTSPLDHSLRTYAHRQCSHYTEGPELDTEAFCILF